MGTNTSLKTNTKKKSKEELWMDIMNKLTNWQNTKWARAGRPGFNKKDIKELRKWQQLKHWKQVLREKENENKSS